MLTTGRLHEVLHYDKETGLFTWKVSLSPRGLAGTIAGCKASNGYRTISIDGAAYLGHRLAWFYVHGKWPTRIDHRDNVPGNDWISNLRPVTPSQNRANSRQPRNSCSPYKGVAWYPRKKKWRATITKDYRRISLGYFHSSQDARDAYIRGAELHFGEFARVG